MQKFKAIMSDLWQMWVSKPFEYFVLLFSRERQKEENIQVCHVISALQLWNTDSACCVNLWLTVKAPFLAAW